MTDLAETQNATNIIINIIRSCLSPSVLQKHYCEFCPLVQPNAQLFPNFILRASLREVVNKKKHIFYGQADRKGWPPPLTVSSFVFFSEVYIWLLFLIKHELKQILTKKMFFDPLYDPFVVWRWAFQIEANTTAEPRMQWREVH